MIDKELVRSLIDNRYHIEHINQSINGSGNIDIKIIHKNQVLTYYILNGSANLTRSNLIPKDLMSLNQLSFIFKTKVIVDIKEDFISIMEDLKFLKAFCLGGTSQNSFCFSELMKMQNVNFNDHITDLNYQTELSDLNYFKVKYHIYIEHDNGQIVKRPQYYNYTAAGEKRILTEHWQSFKLRFLEIYGAKKLNIMIDELRIQDSKVLPMLNI
jgi:hypothetical protein